ncbi:MAG: ABC transporter permease [Gammaproteobacteria bacterium]
MSTSAVTNPGRLGAGLIAVALPLVNIGLALLASGAVIMAIGEDPLEAGKILIQGALGSGEAIGYTLYYSTNLIFTGLAVAVAFHAGLFNIGGEGQAYVGGLGVTLVALGLDAHLPLVLLLPLALAGAALFGAAWAFIPAWLQARRGSHIVITTIMFNFIGSALMVYLLVNVLIRPGSMTPETRMLAEDAWLPFMHELLGLVGIEAPSSPLNLTFFWALIACAAVWVYVWKTRWGFELRTVGANEAAAVYAGISPARVIVTTMCISGGLAGFVAINEVLGVHHRLFLDFPAGYGFTGIAVALMGRNHPLGIIIAAVLFGVLYQGGAELAFEIPSITRDLVVVIQGLVILFCGALEYMARPWLEGMLARVVGARARVESAPA